jgi:hypothetical protein
MTRTRITVEEVAADATDAYEITVHGDVAIKSLTIHGEGPNAWTATQYVNGGSTAGTPAHWHSYVRITEDAAEEPTTVHAMTTLGATPKNSRGSYLPEHPLTGGVHRMSFEGICRECSNELDKQHPGWDYYVKLTLLGAMHEDVAFLTKLCNDCDPLRPHGMEWNAEREAWMVKRISKA